MVADDRSTVQMREGLFVGLSRVQRARQAMDRRLGDIENDPAARLEMVPDGGEARELLFYRQKILELTERQSNETVTAAEVEAPHVSLVEANAPPNL